MNEIRINRRTFLAAAGAATAPLFLPVPLLRAASSTRANSAVAIGVIGTGKQGYMLLQQLLGRDTVRVVSVCDVDTTRREKSMARVNEKYGNADCRAFNDHRELLAKSKVDAVLIATPDHWHTAQIVDSAAAGKDIYCEKPLTMTLHESKLCIDAVRKHKRVLQTGSQQRSEYDGRFRKACEFIRAGRIGPIQAVYVGVGDTSVPCDLPEESMEPGLDWDRWLGPAPLRPYNAVLSPRGMHDHYPDWRKYREYSGGMMTDWGAHHFDIVQWALDADASGPVQVIAPDKPGAKRGVRLRYASGVEVIHGGPPYGVLFVGERGTLYVDRDRLETKPSKAMEETLAEGDTRLEVGGDHLNNWIDCMHQRKDPICHVEVGARSSAVCHLGNLAYWHGRSLQWDPAAWEFPGDAAANSWRDYERRRGYELPGL